jgi:hypothetical protein
MNKPQKPRRWISTERYLCLILTAIVFVAIVAGAIATPFIVFVWKNGPIMSHAALRTIQMADNISGTGNDITAVMQENGIDVKAAARSAMPSNQPEFEKLIGEITHTLGIAIDIIKESHAMGLHLAVAFLANRIADLVGTKVGGEAITRAQQFIIDATDGEGGKQLATDFQRIVHSVAGGAEQFTDEGGGREIVLSMRNGSLSIQHLVDDLGGGITITFGAGGRSLRVA